MITTPDPHGELLFGPMNSNDDCVSPDTLKAEAVFHELRSHLRAAMASVKELEAYGFNKVTFAALPDAEDQRAYAYGTEEITDACEQFLNDRWELGVE